MRNAARAENDSKPPQDRRELTLCTIRQVHISPTPLSKEEKQPATWTREYSRDWHTSEEDSAQGKG